ncbi:MAG: cob(I)yrinic acid a,c-diamide adenosyltransferase [Hyphomicrobiaceae bacterium]|nr:cob(I)yrinic acid a,c-diamide adenosyltransferase [Hyphomicrobiaceae bacterium]
MTDAPATVNSDTDAHEAAAPETAATGIGTPEVGTPETGGATDARHAMKMAKKKAARDKIMAGKSGDKGLVIVHTGTGKGKSSAGFGMILRCIAHEMPCAVVQFIKGAWDTGERRLITSHFGDLCQFHAMGEGFTWETQDRARDIAAARAGWEKAKELILDPDIRFVLLDEINIALRYDYLDIAEVVAFLKDEKPAMTHVVLTGRNAKEEVIELADLVTEMTLVKHPFRSGIKGQPGVEF